MFSDLDKEYDDTGDVDWFGEEGAYKIRVRQAFHDAFGRLDAFKNIKPFDIAHIGGDWSDWRDIFQPGGLATADEVMDGFKKTAGFLFQPRLTAVHYDLIENMWPGHD